MSRSFCLSACVALLTAVAILPAGAARAETYCPRVTTEHNADTTDLKRFRNYAKWKDLKDNDLAIAVWKYLCDTQTGIYHMNEICNGNDPCSQFNTVREPLKMLNVYNYGYCGIFGPTTEGIFYGIGFEPTRSLGIPGWGHCATEIFYANEWHYYDVDVRGVLLRADGIVASIQEARTQRELWTNPPKPIEPFFPGDNPKSGNVFNVYSKSRIDNQYRWFTLCHSMDFSLRPGESFTRYWKPQADRWHHLPSYNKQAWLKTLLKQDPIGPKPNHRDFTIHNHSNGLWHYAPKLTAASKDFEQGVWESTNLVPAKSGLALQDAGKGSATFRIFTPYVIVPKVNDFDNFDDDTEASVITMDAALPVTVSVSLDDGLTWKEAGKIAADKKQTLDLTKLVKHTNGYLVKFEAEGAAGASAIESLAVDTWTQVGPVSIPRLLQGKNQCRYDCGDRFDGVTVPVLIWPNCADKDELKRYVPDLSEKYNPQNITGRMNGTIIAKFSAPAGTKIKWFTVGAFMSTGQGESAKNTNNRIYYAVAKGDAQPAAEDFKQVYKSELPTWINHWSYNYDTDVTLDDPADAVYVKYAGTVNSIRACLHVTPKREQQTAIRITHAYLLDGKMTETAKDLDKPGDYTIDCPGKVENVSLKMEVPSR